MSILPQLEHDLRRAADERLTAGPVPVRARVWRRLGRAVPAIASVAIVIAVGALVLLGHHRRTSPASRATARPAGLLAVLRVLRRPQSAVDPHGLPSHMLWFLNGPGDVRTTRSSIRTVSGADGTIVGILPTAFGSGRRATFGVRLAIAPRQEAGSVTATLTTPAGLHKHGLTACVASPGRQPCAILVPDGVTRVTVTAADVASGQTVSLTDPGAVRVSIPVHDNVAMFTLPELAAVSKRLPAYVYLVNLRVTMAWSSAAGPAVTRHGTLDVTASVNHGQLRSVKDAIPGAQQCARELADCRRVTREPRRGPRRR